MYLPTRKKLLPSAHFHDNSHSSHSYIGIIYSYTSYTIQKRGLYSYFQSRSRRRRRVCANNGIAQVATATYMHLRAIPSESRAYQHTRMIYIQRSVVYNSLRESSAAAAARSCFAIHGTAAPFNVGEAPSEMSRVIKCSLKNISRYSNEFSLQQLYTRSSLADKKIKLPVIKLRLSIWATHTFCRC